VVVPRASRVDGVEVGVGVSVGVGDKAGVSVAISVPVGDGGRTVQVGDGVSIDIGVLVGVADGTGVLVGDGALVTVGVSVDGTRVAVIIRAGVSAGRGAVDRVAATSVSTVERESGLMLRTRATPRHKRTTKAKPPPIAIPTPNLRRLRLSIVVPLRLL